MNINLKMVDEVIERTGVTYKEAKEALIATEGNVLDAIVMIEENRMKKPHMGGKSRIIEKLKHLVDKGIITKILVSKEDEILMNIPIAAGAASALVFTGPTVVVLGVSIAAGCEVYIVKEDGEKVNLKEVTLEKYNTVKNKLNSSKKNEFEFDYNDFDIAIEEQDEDSTIDE